EAGPCAAPNGVVRPGRATSAHSRGNLGGAWPDLRIPQNLPEAARSFAKVLELRPDHRLAQEKSQEIESKIVEIKVSTETPKPSREVSPPLAESMSPTAEEERERDILDEMEEAFSIETSLTAKRAGAAVAPEGPAERPARVRTFVEGLDET